MGWTKYFRDIKSIEELKRRFSWPKDTNAPFADTFTIPIREILMRELLLGRHFQICLQAGAARNVEPAKTISKRWDDRKKG
jgi:hypothetical protein